jgi:hypothetical protein
MNNGSQLNPQQRLETEWMLTMSINAEIMTHSYGYLTDASIPYSKIGHDNKTADHRRCLELRETSNIV